MAPAAPTSTLFGGAPYQTNAPSQGSIMLYTDGNCSIPLTDKPTPWVYGDGGCFAVPRKGIKAVSLATLPACDNQASPMLVLSEHKDCQPSTQEPDPDSGVTGKCQAFASGVDIESLQFACFGKGIGPAPTMTAAPTTTTAALSMETSASQQNHDDGDDDNHSDSCCQCDCCCCCIVM